MNQEVYRPQSPTWRRYTGAFEYIGMIVKSYWPWLLPQRYLRNGLRVLTPVLAVIVLAIAIRPPVNLHATETRPIAAAATRATAPNELITLYDDGAPRGDELNQLQWYGDRYFVPLWRAGEAGKLSMALQKPKTRVFIVDANAYRANVDARVPNQIIARAGHLVCFRLLKPPESARSENR
jgi:hypothetical protein